MRIDIEHLSLSFAEKPVLKDLSFSDEVEALAIIGPSGEGKSTLLRILGGLLLPTAGRVSLDGTAVPTRGRDLVRYRSQLGYVFQDGGLFEHLTVRENIALPLRAVHGVALDKAYERTDALLERFGLVEQAAKHPALLSGGQRQRAAIARAIAPQPRLLLLDEPTSALDPEYTAEVLDLLKDLRRDGVRFVMVTHEMGFARYACKTVAFLNGGSLVEYGLSEDVFAHPTTEQLQRFLGKMLEWSA